MVYNNAKQLTETVSRNDGNREKVLGDGSSPNSPQSSIDDVV